MTRHDHHRDRRAHRELFSVHSLVYVVVFLTVVVLAPGRPINGQQVPTVSTSSPDASGRALLNRYCVT